VFTGAPEQKKCKKQEKIEQNLKRLHDKYEEGNISQEDFLFGVQGNIE
jgi:hypothetical protein